LTESKFKDLALQTNAMSGSPRTSYNITSLYHGIRSGDRASLAKAVTLVESSRDSDRRVSEKLLKKLLPYSGQSLRIGVTGIPGSGKSTFIETLGQLIIGEGKKVAVLAIDPSSQKTKGSILGDKTRMEKLSRNENVFIRPTASGRASGGVAFHTRETILLCEAAGYDVILIETMGVGQSETDVRAMVDFFLLLMLGGGGDELQGIKKGIMEMVDAIAINKADGDNVKLSQQAKADAFGALHLQAPSPSGWTPKVLLMSARENRGISDVWKVIKNYADVSKANGYFEKNRYEQKEQWLEKSLQSHIKMEMDKPRMASVKKRLLSDITKGKLLPSEAAREFWGRMPR
jgi:LAO/AO transport system kinase